MHVINAFKNIKTNFLCYAKLAVIVEILPSDDKRSVALMMFILYLEEIRAQTSPRFQFN